VSSAPKRPGPRGGNKVRPATSQPEPEHGGADAPPARAPARTGSKAGRRADSVVEEVGDDQLVEVAEAVGPRARIALHEQSIGQLGQLRVVVDTFRHDVAASGASGEGVTKVLAAMRSADPPGVVVTAIPGGEPIIEAARRLEPRRPVVIVTGPGAVHELAEKAERLGAELYAVRPHDAERLGPLLAAAARLAAEREELIAARGAQQMLRQRIDRIGDVEAGGLHGFEMFQRVLELELKRARRYGYPLSVAVLELTVEALPTGGDRIVRARATAAIVAAVRDIDLVTELDDGRLVVLLPYTDAPGAARVGERLVNEVASQPPVTIGGIEATSTLRIGIASGRDDEALSFAQLMRDANAALARARDDGAGVVVA
jgi:hypothetical protein